MRGVLINRSLFDTKDIEADYTHERHGVRHASSLVVKQEQPDGAKPAFVRDMHVSVSIPAPSPKATPGMSRPYIATAALLPAVTDDGCEDIDLTFHEMVTNAKVHLDAISIPRTYG